jgi:GT2 family glycosyltransferase
MKNQNPEITIIIVNWNGIRFLPNCLKSIVEKPPSVSCEIVLVDNDSSDKSVEWLKSDEAKEILKDTKFTLIESGENLGFAKANNMAIEKTVSPIVFLLNPDTIIKQNSIDNLFKTLESEKKIGMVAPKLVGADGINQNNAWAFPGASRILIEGLKITKFIPLHYRKKWLLRGSWDYDGKRDVPMVSGAAMMVKRCVALIFRHNSSISDLSKRFT